MHDTESHGGTSWDRGLPARLTPLAKHIGGSDSVAGRTPWWHDEWSMGGEAATDGGRLEARDPRGDVYGFKGWHSRGYLPHFDAGDVAQTVTFRLADSFPNMLLAAWHEELAHLPEQQGATERRRRLEAYLDTGKGAAWLRDGRVARLVEEALLFFDGNRYRLHAWVVMPNHVHALLILDGGYSLSAIVHSWKSYTANKANRILERAGPFWSEDYFDRYVRNDRNFAAAVAYIENNPVATGLCASADAWPYSSGAARTR